MAEEKQNIHRAPDLRKWRIELPNLIDDSDLSPFEVRLLIHYYRVGNCWESVRTTAKKCNMSVGMVVKSREVLHEKKWIIVSQDQNENGTLDITPVNRWPENFKKYSRCSCGEQGCSCGEQGCSCGEPKKEPIKNQPFKKEEEGKTFEQAYEFFQENMGVPRTYDHELLGDMCDEHTARWVIEAMKIAVKKGARNLAYTDAILKRWKTEGYGSEKPNGHKKSKGNGDKSVAEIYAEAEAQAS